MSDDPAQDGAAVDPLTSLATMGVVFHEIYAAYVSAGFSDAQAIYLVGVMLAASLRKEPGSS